jgi:hypothetical protein
MRNALLFISWVFALSFLIVGSALFFQLGLNPLSMILIGGSLTIEALNKREEESWSS